MHECFADAEAMRFWNTPPHVKRIETERAVRRCIDCTPSYHRFWAVADAATDRCLGMVNYHDGQIRNKRAAIGYIINPACQRQAIATEAVSAMLHHCFDMLRLHRVQAFIHPDNAASRALAGKPGFRCEGTLRDNLRVGNAWRDELLYTLLGTDRDSKVDTDRTGKVATDRISEGGADGIGKRGTDRISKRGTDRISNG